MFIVPEEDLNKKYVIYKFTFKCENEYIGKTTRRLKERLNEHKNKHLSNTKLNKSNNKLQSRIKESYQNNEQITVSILYETNCYLDLSEKEKEFISANSNLLNTHYN